MKSKLIGLAAIAAIVAGLAGLGVGDASEAAGTGRIVTGFGVVPGQGLLVHVTVAVSPGQSDRAAVDAALAGQGARRLTSEEFTLTGLVHDGPADGVPGNDDVTIVYHASNQEGVNVQSLVDASIAPWNGESGSALNLVRGTSTGRACPSLLRECPGRQVLNGDNELAFYPLKSPTTLAVTWSSASADEFDIAFNTNFDWADSLAPAPGVVDVVTVGIHEVGHGIGIGHSTVNGAVMEPSYEGVRRSLHQDDKDALLALYGSADPGDPPPDDPAIEVESLVTSVDPGPYAHRQTVSFTVNAQAVGGGDAAGVAVEVLISTPGGRVLGATATTDGSGDAHFSYKVNSRRDGTGEYTIEASGGGVNAPSASFFVE